MWLQHWPLLLILMNNVMENYANSRGFYKGDEELFNCIFDQLELNQPYEKFLQIMVEGNSTRIYDLCYVHYERFKPIATSLYPSVTPEQCQAALNMQPLPVTWKLLDAGKYKCAIDGKPHPSTLLSVDTLKVCPRKISMSASLSEGIFFEDEQVQITCESEGGFPKSQYIYSNPELVSAEISWRFNGVTHSCTDTTHPAWCPASSQSVNLRVFRDRVGVKSKYDPDIYAEEPVVFRCSYRRRQSTKNQFLSSLGIIEHYEEVVLGWRVGDPPPKQKYFPVCRMFDVGAKAYPVNDQLLNTDYICAKAVEKIQGGKEARISIPWRWQRDSSYSCAMYFNNTLDTSSLVQIKHNRVSIPPVNLSILVNNGEDVYAGETIVINCISAGGYPPSVFEYTLDGKTSPRVFTVFKEHNNHTVGCKDKTHPNYYKLHPDSTVFEQQQKLIVYYATATGNFRSRVASKIDEVKLECFVHTFLPEDATFSYIWKIDGVEDHRTSTSSTTISFRWKTNEIWECVVVSSNQRVKVNEVVYAVTWKN